MAKSSVAVKSAPSVPSLVTSPVLVHIDPHQVLLIGRDTKDGPEHPLYDPRVHRPVPADKLESVMKYGVLVPITIRRVKLADGNEADVVVDGRGRVNAAREVKTKQVQAGVKADALIKVWAIYDNAGDEWDSFARSRVLNQYESDDSLTKAQAAKRMLEGFERSDASKKEKRGLKDVALAFGVSDEAIRQWLVLLDDTADDVKAAVQSRALSPTAAVELGKLPKEEQPAALESVLAAAKETGKGKPTVGDVKAEVGKRKGKEDSAPATPAAKLKAAEAFISGWLAKRVARAKRVGGKPITTEDQLDDVTGALSRLLDTLFGKSLKQMEKTIAGDLSAEEEAEEVRKKEGAKKGRGR